MQEAMQQMSEEQKQQRHRCAIKLQSVVRSRQERHRAKIIRAQQEQEAAARLHLLNLQRSPTNREGGGVRSGLWGSIDSVESMVGRMERRADSNTVVGDSPRSWASNEVGPGPDGKRAPTPSSKMTKWDKDNLMAMKKRVMKLERRVREVSRMLVDSIRTQKQQQHAPSSSSSSSSP